MEEYLKPYCCCPMCGSFNTTEAPNGPHMEFRCNDCGFSRFIKKAKNADKDNHRNNQLNKWAKNVKDRDGYKCVICGSTDCVHAHHIFPKEQYPEYELMVNNGITLCQIHHEMLHPWMKKRYGNGH